MEDKRMARKDLKSIKFEKGDLVRPAGLRFPVVLGIVLEQHGMRVTVRWVVGPKTGPVARPPQTRTLVYVLEKVGEEGAK